MDLQPKESHPLPDKVREEALRLKNSILEKSDFSIDDTRQIMEWLIHVQDSPLGRHLLLNKCLDGSWPLYLKDPIHFFDNLLFSSFPALAAMQQRRQALTYAMRKMVCEGMVVGVFPASYVGEWSSLQDQLKMSVVSVNSAHDLMQNEACFDIGIRNIFLYGDQKHDKDIYAALFASLKPGGILLTSTWLPPEGPSSGQLNEVLFFEKLLGMPPCTYHTVSLVKARLRQVGFNQVQILGVEKGPIRTIIAKKPLPIPPPLKANKAISHTPHRGNRKRMCCQPFIPFLA